MIKRIFLLIFCIVLIFSSCTNTESYKKNVVIANKDDPTYINYNGYKYTLYEETDSFEPFFVSYYDGKTRYLSDDTYFFADPYFVIEEDKNQFFIYKDGFLSEYIYLRNDVEIPKTITDSEKIDSISIMLVSPSGAPYDFNGIITNKEEIIQICDYFSTVEPNFKQDETNTSVSSYTTIEIFAKSSYYGGVFKLCNNWNICCENGRIVIKDFKFSNDGSSLSYTCTISKNIEAVMVRNITNQGDNQGLTEQDS